MSFERKYTRGLAVVDIDNIVQKIVRVYNIVQYPIVIDRM